jgi:WD40 repeat protein
VVGTRVSFLDEKHFLVADPRVLAGGLWHDRDVTVRLWDVETEKVVSCHTLGIGHFPFQTLSPDGRLALFGGTPSARDPAVLHVWDIHKGKALVSLPNAKVKKGYSWPAAFDTESKRVLSVRDPSERWPALSFWNAYTGEELWVMEHFLRSDVHGFVFLPDGESVLVACGNGYLFRLHLGTKQTMWEGMAGNVARNALWTVALSQDGKWAATSYGSSDYGAVRERDDIKLTVWDVKDGVPIRDLKLPYP